MISPNNIESLLDLHAKLTRDKWFYGTMSVAFVAVSVPICVLSPALPFISGVLGVLIYKSGKDCFKAIKNNSHLEKAVQDEWDLLSLTQTPSTIPEKIKILKNKEKLNRLLTRLEHYQSGGSSQDLTKKLAKWDEIDQIVQGLPTPEDVMMQNVNRPKIQPSQSIHSEPAPPHLPISPSSRPAPR